MSRSKQKNPITGITTAESEKQDKKTWHRKLRRINKQRIKEGLEPLDKHDVSNPWDMDKDGKQYCPDWDKVWRK